GAGNRVPQALELAHDAGPHLRIVLDHEHTLGATRGGDGLADDRLGRGAGMARQVDPERGPPVDLAGDADMAARLADEAIDHAEAEARALARRLGGEEGLEDLVHVRRQDAVAGVADGDEYEVARRDAG